MLGLILFFPPLLQLPPRGLTHHSCQVIFYDIEAKLQLGNAVQVSSLEGLLATADFVSLHVPADASTRNLIDERRIQQVCQRLLATTCPYSQGSLASPLLPPLTPPCFLPGGAVDR